MRLKFVGALLVAMVLAIAPMTVAYALTSKDVQRELMCQCGCTMTVDVCDCETANQIRSKITELMDQGQNKGQIISYFMGQYGEKMLASPSKKGFNLVAWILPFAAVLAAGTGLFFILKTWVLKGRTVAKAPGALALPVSDAETEQYRGRLEEELRKYREEGAI